MNAGEVIKQQATLNPNRHFDTTAWTSNFDGHPADFVGTLDITQPIPTELFHPLRSLELAQAMVHRYGSGAGFPPRPANDVNAPAVPTADFANGGWLEGENWQPPTPSIAAQLNLDLPLTPQDEMDLRACHAFSEQVKVWNARGSIFDPNLAMRGSSTSNISISTGNASNTTQISAQTSNPIAGVQALQASLSLAQHDLEAAKAAVQSLSASRQRAAAIAEVALKEIGPTGGGLPIKKMRAKLTAIVAELD